MRLLRWRRKRAGVSSILSLQTSNCLFRCVGDIGFQLRLRLWNHRSTIDRESLKADSTGLQCESAFALSWYNLLADAPCDVSPLYFVTNSHNNSHTLPFRRRRLQAERCFPYTWCLTPPSVLRASSSLVLDNSRSTSICTLKALVRHVRPHRT